VIAILLGVTLWLIYERSNQQARMAVSLEGLRAELSVECSTRLETAAEAAQIGEDMLNARIQVLEKNVQGLKVKIEEAEKASEQLKAKLRDAEEFSEDDKARLGEADTLTKEYKAKFEKAKRLYKDRDNKLKETKELVEDLNDKLKEAEGSITAAKKRENKYKTSLDDKRQQITELEESLQTVREARCAELNCLAGILPAGKSVVNEITGWWGNLNQRQKTTATVVGASTAGAGLWMIIRRIISFFTSTANPVVYVIYRVLVG
jgi:chromosome segregation ATPase